MATGYAYSQFRRRGANPPAVVGVALTLEGILSTVAFTIVVAAAAIVSGNPAAAAGLAGDLAAVVGTTFRGRASQRSRQAAPATGRLAGVRLA